MMMRRCKLGYDSEDMALIRTRLKLLVYRSMGIDLTNEKAVVRSSRGINVIDIAGDNEVTKELWSCL